MPLRWVLPFGPRKMSSGGWTVCFNVGFYDNDHSSVEIDPDLWKLTMDVNFNGALLLAQLTLPSMLEYELQNTGDYT
jgi:NADP-dependent 3-hydroxy acid dehydrogenase YdfG